MGAISPLCCLYRSHHFDPAWPSTSLDGTHMIHFSHESPSREATERFTRFHAADYMSDNL